MAVKRRVALKCSGPCHYIYRPQKRLREAESAQLSRLSTRERSRNERSPVRVPPMPSQKDASKNLKKKLREGNFFIGVGLFIGANGGS